MLVPDEELETTAGHEIVEFKDKNVKLLRQFSYGVRARTLNLTSTTRPTEVRQIRLTG